MRLTITGLAVRSQRVVKGVYVWVLESPLTIFFSVVCTVAFGELVLINLSLISHVPWEKLQIAADIFNKTSIGFGALLAGLGGFKYIEDYLARERVKVKRRIYLDLYPVGHSENFDIVEREGKRGELYCRDKKSKIVRHVGNRYTYHELGWPPYGIKTLSDTEFGNYNKGDTILLAGEIGT